MTVVRYADDLVMGFEGVAEARWMVIDFKARLAGFGSQLHEEKAKLIQFGRFAATTRRARGDKRPKTFAFLGFTHYRGTTRDGHFIVNHETQSTRLTRELTAIRREMRRGMHQPLALMHRWLATVLRGHYGCFGMPHDRRSLDTFRQDVRRIWFESLQRRSQKDRRMAWDWSDEVTACLPLPLPRIAHPLDTEGGLMRVTSGKGRARESRLPGSVRAKPNGRATRPRPPCIARSSE